MTIAADELAARDQRWRSPVALFPPSTPRQLTWAAAARSAVLIAVGAAIFVLRQPSSIDNLYSEDGAIFIPQALAGSPWHAITTSYAGYLHLAPRLISELVAALPLSLAARALAVMSGVVVASIGLLVYHASAASIPSRSFRAVIGGALVLMPLAHEEYLANIANIHWALLFGAFVVLFWRPTARWEAGVGSLVVALAALSDPLVLFLVPVAVVRLFALHGWRQHAISWTFIVCSALQAAVLVASHDARVIVGRTEPEHLALTSNPVSILVRFTSHVMARGVFGYRGLEDPHSPAALLGAAAVCLGVAVLAWFAWRAGPSSKLVIALGAALFAGFIFYLGDALSPDFTPSRYAITPVLLLLYGAALLLGSRGREGEVSAPTWLTTGFLVLILAVWSVNFRIDTERAHDHSWKAALEEAESECRAGDSETEATVPIYRWFTAELPCHAVRG